jgi:hypothetical protein
VEDSSCLVILQQGSVRCCTVFGKDFAVVFDSSWLFQTPTFDELVESGQLTFIEDRVSWAELDLARISIST